VFSGIIKGQGAVREASRRGGDLRLVIGTSGVELGPIAAGDSIAVNGVCLTAIEPSAEAFAADVSLETLERTTLGTLAVGAPVNLEASLRLGQTIDGHLVYGHVDGIGRVRSLDEAARSLRLTIELPPDLRRYIAVKGSVAVDGVSLTVNAVDRNRFSVNIVPHTRAMTVISRYEPGCPVNIEVDMIARYLERLFEAEPDGLSEASLERHGFIESK
jgi:riboflavin synthase